MRELLLQNFLLLLVLGSVAGVMFGVLLLWRPDWLLRISGWANRRVSTRQAARPLDRQVSADHWVYRNSRLAGGVLLLGSLYVLVTLLVRLDRPAMLNLLVQGYHMQSITAEVVLDALMLLWLAGTVLALLVSLFLSFRPSSLREFEEVANRYVSLRQQSKPLEIERGEVDRYVFGHVQLAGVLMLCGSLYVLVMLAYWLQRQ